MLRFLALLMLALQLHGTETLRIATYNVENLFDLERSGHEYSEYIPNTQWQWNADKYRIKLNNLARVIEGLRPDVIALQEIESDAALRDLQIALKRRGLYLPHRAIADAKRSTVKTALLSRFPIKVKREIRVSQSLKYRNILEIKLDIGGEPLYLFVNHWKSKSGPESMRLRSAKALKQRLDGLGDVNYVLLSDFNSHCDEKQLFKRNRKHNDTGGITGINDILQTSKRDRHIMISDLKTCGTCSANLWFTLDEKKRWSHKYRGKGEALDAIIISPRLADGKGLEYVSDSFTPFKPDFILKNGAPYRWQQSRGYPKHHLGIGYSDHLPIYAEFRAAD